MNETTQLADLLEEEIAVGEALERNLAAQKQALVDWNVDELLRQITAREGCLRLLTPLENKRIEISKRIYISTQALTVRQFLLRLPQDAPDTARLRRLRARARELFTRLNRTERSLHDLMGILLAHVQEALQPLMRSATPLYSETGTAEPARSGSALIHNKA